jgi:single-strand DNA-binding protein
MEEITMSNLNLNKVILGGRLTQDIELKQTPSGVSVCSFSIAVKRRTGKDQEQKTDFIDCTAWRQTAEFIARYFRKGSSICVSGSIQKRSWQDQNGQNRYATEVVVDEAMFVDSKNDAQSAEATTADQMPAPTFNAPQTANFEPINAESDDLPF